MYNQSSDAPVWIICMHLPRTLKKIFAELFLMLLVATQVMIPSSAFVAEENVSTP